jgi:hypothetical protein
MEKVSQIITSLASRIPEYNWLNSQLSSESNFIVSDFYLSFNLIHRKIKDAPFEFTKEEKEAMSLIYPGFKPIYWTTRSIARSLMVLNIPDDERKRVLDDLFSTADIQELETLYRALYLLPDPGNYRYRGAEGIRTNMTRVFDALALDNPFPAEYFDEGAWNQMVLKAIFMQRPLYRIVGLDDRHNDNLARIASDFAHERWAASRPVTPELWRLLTVGNTVERRNDIERILASDDALEQAAGELVLAAWENGHQPAESAESWNSIGKKFEENELH